MFPCEVYYKILKHVPYKTLYGSIRLVNHQFSQIASEILEKHERVWLKFYIDYRDGKHVAQWFPSRGRYLRPEDKRSLPECDPPSFIRIQRLTIFGRITKELILFLNRIKKAMICCRIDFEKVDDFILDLLSLNITVDDFFSAFPEK
ncbi:unnamed protein product [Meloidogyne enterolobii]|uniref:Uncharacterized protein n=1 Tax=Meloidogyne enterolobii TaxID=390850 RepID=A0ACB0ZT67_MELEN